MDTRASQQRASDAEARARAPLPPPRDAATLRNELQAEPLQPAALRELATAAGQTDIGLLKLADRVSRRDPTTQILLLDEAARAGDLDQALRHYDVLLSTRPSAAPALYAQLAIALENEEIRQKLKAYGKRDWFSGLIAFAAAEAEDARPAAQLAVRARQFEDPKTADRLAPLLLSRLAQQGHLEEAFELASLAAHQDRSWRDFDFTRASLDQRLAPVTWALFETANARGELAPNGNVAVTVDPLTSGQVLRRITRLGAGTYEFWQLAVRTSGPAAALEWRVTCQDGGAEADLPLIGEQRLVLKHERTLQRADVSIPASCPYQEWALRVRGEDAQSPSSFYFEEFRLEAR